jgi:hypothetical protein
MSMLCAKTCGIEHVSCESTFFGKVFTNSSLAQMDAETGTGGQAHCHTDRHGFEANAFSFVFFLKGDCSQRANPVVHGAALCKRGC